MFRAVVAALLSVAVFPLFAQTPFVVRDLNTSIASTRSSSPQGFLDIGGTLYFVATEQTSGTELWKYSGGQVSLLADVSPGVGSSSPSLFLRLRDDLIVFAATSPTYGRELWATDGTTGGTRLIKDIHPSDSSTPTPRTIVNGKVLFVANDGVAGFEPWVTDGTEGGTRRLIDLDETSASTTINMIVAFGSQALIFARGGIWSSDGTPEGTISVVPPNTLGSAAGFTSTGSTAYFTSNAGAGRELWKTDGTAAGTVRVKDIAPGPASGIVGTPQLVTRAGHVYFIASESGTTFDLWKSDGTEGGTQLVKAEVHTPPHSGVLLTPGATLFYLQTNRGLWRSDGTTGGTFLVDSDPGVFGTVPAFGGVYYLRQVNGLQEMWATSTTGAPRLIKQFSAGAGARILRFTGGKLYFAGTDRLHGEEPWVSTDGTAATMSMLANIAPDPPPSSNPTNLTAAGNLVYFMAAESERRQLWRSDGTANGTLRLTSLGDQWNDPWLELFTGWRGALYFKHDYAQLWRSDGTVAGTALLENFAQGYNTPSVSELFPASSYLYLDANDGDGPMAWRTDGTSAGTIDLSTPGSAWEDQPIYPDGFVELAGRVYFLGGVHDPGIFVSDGTPASTKRIALFAYAEDATTPLATGAGALFFSRVTTAGGEELWRSDGTAAGTALVKDIVAGAGSSSPRELTGSDRHLFFVAGDEVHGVELWRTDGTAAGTILLKDIRTGSVSSAPSQLTVVGNILYFVADDGVAGAELWRSDGTAAGTVLVSDIRAGATGSDPRALRAADGALWFAADDGTHGVELWRTTSDGDVTMVADLDPGAGSSSPSEMTKAGSLLYFTAAGSLGRELWALTPTTFPVLTIDDVRVAEGNSGTKNARFTVTRSGNTAGSSTVTYTTLDVSAAAGTDYVAKSGSLTFAAGVTTQFIDVVVNGDAAIEQNEAFVVAFTGATGAVLANVSAIGTIEDDDARAELSIEWLGSSWSGESFRITNAGPSMATEVTFRVSESPGKFSYSVREQTINGRSCGGEANPISCAMGFLGAGESLVVLVQSSEGSDTWWNPDQPPGVTVTADVRASQIDTNAADSSVTRMIGAGLEMPPFLTNGKRDKVTFRLSYESSSNTVVTLQASSPDVVISPASVTVPPGSTTATFDVTPQNFVGRVRLTAAAGWNAPQSVMTTVVQSGTLPKLDVAITRPYPVAIYGVPVDIPVEIAARKHDGTRPTGTVTLLTENDTVLAQQPLTNGATTFRRTGLAPGTHRWKLHYSGDVNFNALQHAPLLVTVRGMPTETTVEIPGYFCGTAKVTVRVRNTATTEVPAGTVLLQVGTENVTLALAPSGAAGEAIATIQRTFAATTSGYLNARFQPSSSTFASSGGGEFFWSVNCAPFNLVATARGAQVSLSWSPQTGAQRYEILYAYNRTGWVLVGAGEGQWTSATSFVHTTYYTSRVIPYVVRAIDAAGNVISYSAQDLANTMILNDDPIVPRVTVVTAAHITQLQEAANSLRFMVDYRGVEFPAAVPGSLIRPARIVELREAINRFRVGMGLPAVTFTDPNLTAGSTIKAVHVQELRNALN